MNNLWKEFFAEIIGTAILMLLGISGAACTVLSKLPLNFPCAFGYAFGVVIASVFAGPISGAHINPAITVALTIIGKFQWYKVPIYLLGQYIGSFIGTLLSYLIYYESIIGFEMDNNYTESSIQTAQIFITIPTKYITIIPAIFDQIISTGLLTLSILFINDEKSVTNLLKILTIGLIVMTMIVGFNFNCGAILNPARDLSPRILLSFVGYGSSVFKHLNYNFWWAVGIIGPHLGAIIGALSYYYLSNMRNDFIDDDNFINDDNNQQKQKQIENIKIKSISLNNSFMISKDDNGKNCKSIIMDNQPQQPQQQQQQQQINM